MTTGTKCISFKRRVHRHGPTDKCFFVRGHFIHVYSVSKATAIAQQRERHVREYAVPIVARWDLIARKRVSLKQIPPRCGTARQISRSFETRIVSVEIPANGRFSDACGHFRARLRRRVGRQGGTVGLFNSRASLSMGELSWGTDSGRGWPRGQDSMVIWPRIYVGVGRLDKAGFFVPAHFDNGLRV